MSLPNDVEGLTLLEIADPIREDAAETLEYLRSEDVTLKIISGDNPVTVSHIAHQAGFADYQSYIDCSKVSDEELEALAEDTAIFGRVSPHQKKLLIQTLNANGHTTAMTGDGVNDILALREADCSIVMAEGDPLHVRLLTWCLWIPSLRIFLKFYLRDVVWLIILPTLHRFSSLKLFIPSFWDLSVLPVLFLERQSTSWSSHSFRFR